MSQNLADLLLARAARTPKLRIGFGTDLVDLTTAVSAARRIAAGLLEYGCQPGSRIAMVEQPDMDYLVFWMGCQLAGVAPALINPHYPVDLLQSMLDDLDPLAIAARPERVLRGKRQH